MLSLWQKEHSTGWKTEEAAKEENIRKAKCEPGSGQTQPDGGGGFRPCALVPDDGRAGLRASLFIPGTSLPFWRWQKGDEVRDRCSFNDKFL